jgi:hypothetical protein
VALPLHLPQPLQVCSQSGTDKGHITLQAETVFRPYIASHFSVVTHTSQVAFPPHAPKPLELWLKSDSKKGQFTLEVETVFSLYHAPHCRGVTQTSHVALPPHAPKPVQVWLKQALAMDTLLLGTKQFLVRNLSRIEGDDSNITSDTPLTFAKTTGSSLEIGQ